jgi:hypothetical protein
VSSWQRYQRRISSVEQVVLQAMWLKHDTHLQVLAALTRRLGHEMLLDPVELSLRETVRCCEAELEVGLQCACEGGHAGSLWCTPSLAPFWQHCGRREHACALHGHHFDVVAPQPIVQSQQIRCHRQEGARILLDRPIGLGNHHRRHHRLFMHISGCAAVMDHLHRFSPALASTRLAA